MVGRFNFISRFVKLFVPSSDAASNYLRRLLAIGIDHVAFKAYEDFAGNIWQYWLRRILSFQPAVPYVSTEYPPLLKSLK